jgi:hypothetical protein
MFAEILWEKSHVIRNDPKLDSARVSSLPYNDRLFVFKRPPLKIQTESFVIHQQNAVIVMVMYDCARQKQKQSI